jgi:hypothetical protein
MAVGSLQLITWILRVAYGMSKICAAFISAKTFFFQKSPVPKALRH